MRTVDVVPTELDNAEVLVLNSIPSEQDSIPEDRILRSIDGGGGVFAVHDSVYPYAYNRDFVSACGIRNAYEDRDAVIAITIGLQMPASSSFMSAVARAFSLSIAR